MPNHHTYHDPHDSLEVICTRHDERITQLSKAQQSFITKAEFEPIKRIVYTTVGLIITSVLIAALRLVLK